MNRADIEMLNSSLQNVAQGALQRKQLSQQHEAEMQRMALEAQMRDIQESRYNAQAAHFNKMEEAQQNAADQANQPKIQATITHPNGTTMDFIGTPQQLEAMQQKEPGLKISGKKEFSAKFDVGGSSFMFSDPESAQKFAADMKTKNGIDVYANQPKPVTPKQPTQTIRQVVNPERVVEGVVNTNVPPYLSLTNSTTPMATNPAPVQSNQPPVVHTQEDYDALPAGASYIDSFGRKAVKKQSLAVQ